jgi:hypothetical protein
MTRLKTRPNRRSVAAFLAGIRDPEQRRDARAVAAMMRAETGSRPRMWGHSIVGYGVYRYRRAGGKEAEWFQTGFSPRVGALTLYIMTGFPRHRALMRKLGKHSTGRACLYVKRLSDVNAPTLRRLIRESVRALKIREARS